MALEIVEQAQRCGGVIPVNGIPTLSDDWISNNNTYNNKECKDSTLKIRNTKTTEMSEYLEQDNILMRCSRGCSVEMSVSTYSHCGQLSWLVRQLLSDVCIISFR